MANTRRPIATAYCTAGKSIKLNRNMIDDRPYFTKMPKATTSPRYRDPLADWDIGLFESFVDSQTLLIFETPNDKKWELGDIPHIREVLRQLHRYLLESEWRSSQTTPENTTKGRQIPATYP